MRCRILEGPWGSHQDEARALKCETSSGETVVNAGSDEDEVVLEFEKERMPDELWVASGCAIRWPNLAQAAP